MSESSESDLELLEQLSDWDSDDDMQISGRIRSYKDRVELHGQLSR